MRLKSPLPRGRKALIAGVTAVALAAGGTAYGLSAQTTDVTLLVDGQPRQVSADADTVGEVLAAEGVDVGERDVVAPSLDSAVDDGSEISVRYARLLELTVNDETETHWVTADDVSGALAQIGSRFSGAQLSASRGDDIDREGMTLEVVTPRPVAVKVGARKVKTEVVTAMTVRSALKELGVKVDKDDELNVKMGKRLRPGSDFQIRVTRVRTERKPVKGQAIGFETEVRETDELDEGESRVVKQGRDGAQDLVYRLTFRNGTLADRSVVSRSLVRAPVNRVVEEGTNVPEPAPVSSGSNFASGSTVWDSLAACESGGNWAINTGNGYYGGLQFNLQTWQGYGGSGLPNENSREEQIRIATKVRDARGGYGAWPACSQSLGLPQ